MGVLNLGTARAELLARGFDYLPATRANQFLFWAHQEIADFPNGWWPWDEATATGTGSVTLTDLKGVLSVADTGRSLVLDGTTREEMVAGYSVLTTTGAPAFWYLEDQTVKLYPVSASTPLSVRYVKTPAALASDSDNPTWPVRFDELWIDLAVLRAVKDSSDVQDWLPLRQDIDNRLSKLEMSAMGRRLDGTVHIGVSDIEAW